MKAGDVKAGDVKTGSHPKLRRWGPWGLAPALILVSVNFLDGMEANFIPGVLSLLQDEWGFGDTAAGAIPTAMAIAGLLVTLPAGYLADRHNRTTVLALVVASWSVFTLASALATSFAMCIATSLPRSRARRSEKSRGSHRAKSRGSSPSCRWKSRES